MPYSVLWKVQEAIQLGGVSCQYKALSSIPARNHDTLPYHGRQRTPWAGATAYEEWICFLPQSYLAARSGCTSSETQERQGLCHRVTLVIRPESQDLRMTLP